MTLILELITLGLAIAYCWQQLKQIAQLLKKDEPKKTSYNPENYKAGCYDVRWH